MRPATQRKIDALHAQISRLIELEKRYHDKMNPEQNTLWRSISHTKIEMAKHCPEHRANMIEAVASFRPGRRDKRV